MADTTSLMSRAEVTGSTARRSEETIEAMKRELDRVQSLIEEARRSFEADPYIHSGPEHPDAEIAPGASP